MSHICPVVRWYLAAYAYAEKRIPTRVVIDYADPYQHINIYYLLSSFDQHISQIYKEMVTEWFMKKHKRVSVKEAKKIFHKRSLRSQAIDRSRTAKNPVYPNSKRSGLWAQNPNKYDMHFVDTKPLIKKTIIQGNVFYNIGKVSNISEAKLAKRDFLASFTKKVAIPLNMDMKELEQISGAKIKYRKKEKGYDMYMALKKSGFSLWHPVFMQRRQ